MAKSLYDPRSALSGRHGSERNSGASKLQPSGQRGGCWGFASQSSLAPATKLDTISRDPVARSVKIFQATAGCFKVQDCDLPIGLRMAFAVHMTPQHFHHGMSGSLSGAAGSEALPNRSIPFQNALPCFGVIKQPLRF